MQRAARVVHRAGQRHAGAEHPLPVHAGLVEHLRDELGRVLERPGASWSTSSRTLASASTVRARSLTATRILSWSKSIPTAAPADGSSASCAAGRPCRPAGASVLSTTRPARCSSPITVETVDGDRPVWRAISSPAGGSVVAEGIHYAQSVELTQ